MLLVRCDFVSHGLATENTYGSNRTYAMETVEQRLSTAGPLLEVDGLHTQLESGIFYITIIYARPYRHSKVAFT